MGMPIEFYIYKRDRRRSIITTGRQDGNDFGGVVEEVFERLLSDASIRERVENTDRGITSFEFTRLRNVSVIAASSGEGMRASLGLLLYKFKFSWWLWSSGYEECASISFSGNRESPEKEFDWECMVMAEAGDFFRGAEIIKKLCGDFLSASKRA